MVRYFPKGVLVIDVDASFSASPTLQCRTARDLAQDELSPGFCAACVCGLCVDSDRGPDHD